MRSQPVNCYFEACAILNTGQFLPDAGEEPKEWQNPKLTGLNNEPPHAILVACPDIRTAQSIQLVNNRERVKSPFYRSLNGHWKYHYAANFSQRISGFWTPDFND